MPVLMCLFNEKTKAFRTGAFPIIKNPESPLRFRVKLDLTCHKTMLKSAILDL